MKACLDELLYTELHPTIRALSDGGFDKELADLVRKPGNAAKAVEAMRRELIGSTTWRLLLDDCCQFSIDRNFTESRWPLERLEADENDWEVVEYQFSDRMAGAECLRKLNELTANGEIRLLTGARRAMIYIAQHTRAQLQHPIVLPIRTQDSYNKWAMPVFGNESAGEQWFAGVRPILFLQSTSDMCNTNYCWLVLRRKRKS